jgi:outer membrane protein OmpA-like peptidoglycan-associated protein
MCLVTFLVISAAGCTTGRKLRGQAEEIQNTNGEIRDRAYRCAPQSLATAEAQVDFGLYELQQGNFVRARKHIYSAEDASSKADRRSDYEVCRSQQASMDIEETQRVEIDESPKDRDGDGLLDPEDSCPKKPEDFDGFEDKDGCPDTDNDEDGIADNNDGCPNVPEGEYDGYRDDDGCPDPDNDADGFADINDGCADGPEDFDGYEDADGCADTDNDDDGIADVLDECPNEAEDYDGDLDDDGCPEQRKRVTVSKDKIELNEKVYFAYDKAKIQSRSYALLDEVAQVLKDNPDINVRVEGHTDSRGGDSYNQKLSQRRAESVVDYLTNKGITRSRLNAKGFGESQPIASNSTEAGRAKNRRVEIEIINR